MDKSLLSAIITFTASIFPVPILVWLNKKSEKLKKQ
jgi:membrane-bound metal-dependent hydrolase YbcI (DUF457 family)